VPAPPDRDHLIICPADRESCGDRRGDLGPSRPMRSAFAVFVSAAGIVQGHSTRRVTLRFLRRSTINRGRRGATKVTSGLADIRRAWWRRRRRARAAAAAMMAVMALLLAGCGNAGAGAAIAPRLMSVGSEAFSQNVLPQRYTCRGGDVTPPLDWSGAPAGTKSIAIVVDDSSAPITPFIYWLVFHLGPGTTDIQEGRLPAGARQAQNSEGIVGYDAPCPNGHPHSYRFTVYALSTMLSLPAGAPLLTVWTAIAAATIGRGRIVVTGNP
jgi:Raf kinase inhibitor-like YbhB/YbcL family protein